MAHYQIALLRGINVGKAKRVAMADLRTLVENLGYGDVATLLNSGNVVFTTPRASAGNATARIEKGIAEQLGVACRVTVLSGVELISAIEANPLLDRADNHSRLMAGVLANVADSEKVKPLLKQKWKPEAIAIHERIVFYWCPNSILESPVAIAVARALGDGVTSRNWATMLKLHQLIAA